ncbi:MAG: 8-oxoguanine deaminase [Ardenticatenales bacterium]|nr:8-oxoguanine deaminase [Ardenticatenales bacterium]
MGTLLLKSASILVTMDDERREIPDGGLFVRDNVIEAVGPMAELPQEADRIIDLTGHILLPGLINTHHHLYQTLTRAVPAAQDATLFDWLNTLYPIWTGLTSEAIYISTLVGTAELLRSGCTTSSDHLYLYPHDVRLDDQIRAVQEMGIRFHALRGSMSLGKSKGGLPPDKAVEDEGEILRDSSRLIETYHDPAPYAMLRIALAPCSPFSVTPRLMRQSAELAREHGVHLHSHLAETLDEQDFCVSKFGMRPVALAEDLGWLGEDVWHAHCVHLNDDEIELFARTGTGVAHCPSSNMRLASGIAPIRRMLDAGVRVGVAVDGSASNDGSHMLAETRQAMLLQRVMANPNSLSAREALEMATRGGAAVLGRDDIGQLSAGKAADCIAINLNRLAYAGSLHDPVAAIVFCAPQNVDLALVNGRLVVSNGQVSTVEMGPIIERHNAIARRLARGEGAADTL